MKEKIRDLCKEEGEVGQVQHEKKRTFPSSKKERKCKKAPLFGSSITLQNVNKSPFLGIRSLGKTGYSRRDYLLLLLK